MVWWIGSWKATKNTVAFQLPIPWPLTLGRSTSQCRRMSSEGHPRSCVLIRACRTENQVSNIRQYFRRRDVDRYEYSPGRASATPTGHNQCASVLVPQSEYVVFAKILVNRPSSFGTSLNDEYVAGLEHNGRLTLDLDRAAT